MPNAKAKTKIEAPEELASEISTQCVMGTANTLIERLSIPKNIVMHAMAQGLGVMATNPDGTNDLDRLFKTIRSASKQTASHYRTHPESGENDNWPAQVIDDDYNIAFDILTQAVQKMGAQGITRSDVLPSLVDFTATIAVALGGEEAIKACIVRLSDRIKDLNSGTFPVTRN
jgi:hypothetical protein